MNATLIAEIVIGVFLAELLMSFLVSGVTLYRQRKLAKSRAAELEEFSNAMLARFQETEDAEASN